MLLLAGCSEYGLNDKDDNTPGTQTAGIPDLLADPDVVSLTGLCERETVTVSLQNAGDGTLTISSIAVTGSDWSLSEELVLPLTVEPDTAEDVVLVAGEGSATLEVVSDDPDTPTLSVPLAAEFNAPPVVTITQPANGTVIDEGGTVVLEAEVTDDLDATAGMEVRWSSDVDGDIGSAVVDSTGRAVLSWDAADRSPGDHMVEATVVDSCSADGFDETAVCQQAFETTKSVDLASWNYEGIARWDSDNDWVELTDVRENQVGSAFDVTTNTRGTEVTIAFQFWMGSGTGADGFALTALDLDRATSYLGSGGGCLGYGNGTGCSPAYPALPGWSIEFDTYANGKWDPTGEDHVAFVFDGDVSSVEAWSAVPDLEDSAWHSAVIEVSDPRVRVEIDGVTYIDTDLTGYFDFPAHVGFSASTGGLTNYHIIDALTVTDAACPVE